MNVGFQHLPESLMGSFAIGESSKQHLILVSVGLQIIWPDIVDGQNLR